MGCFVTNFLVFPLLSKDTRFRVFLFVFLRLSLAFIVCVLLSLWTAAVFVSHMTFAPFIVNFCYLSSFYVPLSSSSSSSYVPLSYSACAAAQIIPRINEKGRRALRRRKPVSASSSTSPPPDQVKKKARDASALPHHTCTCLISVRN